MKRTLSLLLSGLLLAAVADPAAAAVRTDCRNPGALCGLVDERGETVLEPKYDDIGEFVDGYAVFRQGAAVGIIDATGKEMAPAVYDEVEQLRHGYAVVVGNGQRTAIDMHGNTLVPAGYHVIRILGEGSFIAGKYRRVSSDPSRAQWAVVNTRDGTVTDVAKENLYAVTRHAPPQRVVTGDRAVGFDLIDHTGKVLLQGMDDVHELGPAGSGPEEVTNPLYVFVKDGKAGAVDVYGNVVIPFAYDRLRISPAHAHIAFRKTADDKFGYMTHDGTVLIAPRFDEAGTFDLSNRAPVIYAGVRGWIDPSGKYDTDNVCDDGRRLIKNGGKYVVMGGNGKPLHRERWDEVDLFCDRPSRVVLGRRSGYLNADGSLVGGHLYYQAGKAGFREGFAEVWLEPDRMLVLGPDGRRVLGPLPVRAGRFYEHYPEGMTRELLEQAARDPQALNFKESRYCPADGVAIYRGSRYRTVYKDDQGNEMITGRYIDARCFEEGLAWVLTEISERWCRMDKRGEILEDTCQMADPHPAVQKQQRRVRQRTQENYFSPPVKNWSTGWRGL